MVSYWTTIRTICILLLIWFNSITIVKGEQDPACFDNCNCCINKQCRVGYNNWPNVCTIGCIVGHSGSRCYILCPDNCLSCKRDSNECVQCNEGFYLETNKNCSSECPSNCKTCTSKTLCTSCKEGYFNEGGSTTCPYTLCPSNCECKTGTSDCVACKNGYYDTVTSCTNTCPSTCKTCSSLDICTTCRNGFYNGYEQDDNTNTMLNDCTFKCMDTCTQCQSYDNCLQCVDGKYGQKCQHNCSIGCKDQTCNFETGNCVCSTNFFGDKCDKCANRYFGPSCRQACPSHCQNSKCDQTTGLCSDGCIRDTITGKTCNECVAGMNGELCDKVCPTNCLGAKCDRRNGSCSDGCKTNFQGSLCDNCKPGKYGANCDMSCSNKCANSICSKNNGNCLSCYGNFYGSKCDICKPGYFGFKCSDSCSQQCKNTTCSMTSGACDYGCKTDYSGDMCCLFGNNCKTCFSSVFCKGCISGYYGQMCEYACHKSCLDSCDISTGACNYCRKNQFGPFCERNCSENCMVLNSSVARRCASSDGTCIYGCKDGFYGLLCNQTCSSLCKDNICVQESGICLKGCTQSHDKNICFYTIGKNVADSSPSRETISVLATLLAVSLAACSIYIVKVNYRKFRSPKRKKTDDSTISVENRLFEERNQFQRNEGGMSEEDNAAYESIVNVQDSAEHKYNTVHRYLEEGVIHIANTDYINLKV